MRKRRSEEEMIEEAGPIMYRKAHLCLIDGLRSSFPGWSGAAWFDYRNGWTKMDDFFADGYFTREEMKELVHQRFNVVL